MRTFWSRLRRSPVVRELGRPSNALLFARILGFTAVSPLLLRIKPPRLLSILEPKRSTKRPAPPRLDRIVRYTDALLPRRTCMRSAITLYYFLRREGMQLGICFGVALEKGSLRGHCWLVKDGQPFLEREDPLPTFTPIYAFPHVE